jgi:hypothetical protein
MKSDKKSSIEQLQVLGRYESLRKILLSESHRNHLDKPLAYWAVPTDRRLPLALLGRTLDDLLRTPFEEIAATPGVGGKKIRSFVKLLTRAAETTPAQLPVDLSTQIKHVGGAADEASSNGFDPASVSEVVWAQWRQTVLKRGLEREPLGRFAPTLKNMTRVIWTRPLSDYTGLSLAEIRSMKTHGQKRVKAVLEVFHSIHQLVAGMGSQEQLVVRIVPRLIDAVETWVGRTLQTPGAAGKVEIFERFTKPLLGQIRVDSSRQIVKLAEDRLGINGPITSVRQAARTAGLTRARVYQLLNEINDIVNVRWPLGRHQVHELRTKFLQESADGEGSRDLEQFQAAVELFYPAYRRGADGPHEPFGEELDAQEDAA